MGVNETLCDQSPMSRNGDQQKGVGPVPDSFAASPQVRDDSVAHAVPTSRIMPPYIFQIEFLRKTVDNGRYVIKQINLDRLSRGRRST